MMQPRARKAYLLAEWLELLLASSALAAKQATRCLILVDGLVARGDWRAIRLQGTAE
jgi:hypothetical protein